jgi:RNA polymerase sigma-70 factor (ECF subfamily)
MAAGRVAADGRASVAATAAALDARVLFPRVADAIESLPDGEREALLLFAWEELSYQHVADALELPIGTVRSRLNRARARLRELLGASGKERVRTR